MSRSTFGIIGLGTMGRNLALNIEEHGFPVAVWNLETDWTDAFLRDHAKKQFTGARTLESLIADLDRPRRIMMMIPAGAPVDQMIQKLAPLLEPGDILIDGGNSYFEDTRRREAALRGQRLHFVGCGVSGGEEGARVGPSLMPGGSDEAWARIKDVLEAISAKTDAGACVTHVGSDGAGHFVKMVHNGIEYGDMQLISEVYDLLHRGLGLSTPDVGGVFEEWNRGPLESFLVELTAHVCKVIDPQTKQPMVDVIQDKAGQKGTGKWTAQVALDDCGGARRANPFEPEGSARRRRSLLRGHGHTRAVCRARREGLAERFAGRALRGADRQLRSGDGAHRSRIRRVLLEDQPFRNGAYLEGRLHHPRPAPRSGAPCLRTKPGAREPAH